MKKLIIALSFMTLVVSCGKNCDYECDCVEPAVHLKYTNDSIPCLDFQNLVQVVTYSEADDQVIDYASVNTWGCILALPLAGSGQYWVITSDSLNIADTVRVNDVIFEEVGGNECCECPQPVGDVEVMLNGTMYTGDTVVVEY